jgi:hypothetical protein
MGSVTSLELYLGNILDLSIDENNAGKAIVENDISVVPLTKNFVLYPLKGESLLVFRDETLGRQYYMPFPLAILKSTHNNVTEDLENIDQYNFIERENITSVNTRVGDLVVEGRYNNSIRLSHNNTKGEILMRCDVESINEEDSYLDEDVNVNSSFVSLSISNTIPLDLANDNFKSIGL